MTIVSDNFDNAFAQLEQSQDEFLGVLGERGLALIKEETPVRSGNLRDHNEWEVTEGVGDGGGSEGRWHNDADYAARVELGDTDESGGHFPANPYMQRGLDRLTEEADDLAREHFSG